MNLIVDSTLETVRTKMMRSNRFVLTFTLLFYVLSVQSQIQNLNLEVFSGDEPNNIEWTIYDDGQDTLMASDEGLIVGPNESYITEIEFECSDCLRLQISGLGENGSYKIKLDNVWYVTEGGSSDLDLIHYIGTCSRGESCELPEELVLNSVEQNRFTTKQEHWYKLLPTEDRFMTIHSCANFDMDFQWLDTKLWLYDHCPQNPTDGPEGAILYNDESGCNEAAFIYEFKLVPDKEYYIRFLSNAEEFDRKMQLTFRMSSERFGCIDPISCNYDPFANTDDGSCIYDPSCGPDLWVNDTLLINSIHLDQLMVEDECLYDEGCVTGFGMREIVRFTTGIHNIGNADFIVGDPEVNSEGFSENNCHDHWHQLGYASYEIYSGAGQPESIGLKNGFCVLDIGCTTGDPKYNCNYMGITAGCYDIYDSGIACQWLDVTNLPDGIYTVIVKINWQKLPDARGMMELDYTNNIAQVCIRIDRSSGITELFIEDDCPTYVDCFGIINGDSVFDCEGFCGGPAHQGDINGDSHLDSLDIQGYFQRFNIGNLSSNDCIDLDGNESIDLEDAVILKQCLSTGNDNSHPDIYHEHCEFPDGGLLEAIDTMYLSMDYIDFETESISISYSLSGNTALSACSFGIDGAQITAFDPESVFDFQASSAEYIYLLADSLDIAIPQLGFISFDNLIEETICLKDDAKAFNQNYEELVVIIENNCLSTSTNDYDLNEIVDVFPNITSDIIYVKVNKQTKVDQVVILDLQGSMVLNESTSRASYSLGHLVKGYYFLVVSFADGNKSIHKIVIY